MMSLKRGLFWVVLALFLVVFSFLVAAETNGCYIYPKAGEDVYCTQITDAIAKADCDKNADCAMSQHFISNSDCSNLDKCKEVTCDVDCSAHMLGKCQQLGGDEVKAEEYNLKCAPGCCKISNKFCQFNLNQFQCFDKAKKLGISVSEAIFNNDLSMNAKECAEKICQVTLEKGALEVTVKNEEGQAISGVEVLIETLNLKSATSDLGLASVNLNPGTYAVKISGAGYLQASISVVINTNEKNAQSIILKEAEGGASVVGKIGDNKTNFAADLSYQGATSGNAVSNDDGSFTITNLPLGKYTFTASKTGYKALKKEVDIVAGENKINFVLELTRKQGVKGKAILDLDNNKKYNNLDQPAQGAKVYVDNVLRGFADAEGNFMVEITFKSKDANEKHSIYLQSQNYKSKAVIFELEKEKTTDLKQEETLMLAVLGQCDKNKDVQQFSVASAPGKKQVTLQWVKPCPEVIGYELTITDDAGSIIKATFSPADFSYIDDKVEWGKTYTYSLIALFDLQKLSDKANVQTIKLGDKECEGHYHDKELLGWDQFCRTGDKKLRQAIWSCTDDNKLYEIKCGEDNEGLSNNFYCAQVSEREAVCKDDGVCAKFRSPFGLYAERETCYGLVEEQAKNFCVYDFSYSIVDSCKSCLEIKSCFDYNGKDACTLNNCLSDKCRWIDGADNKGEEGKALVDYGLINLPLKITPETGTGYCTPVDYTEDDKCELCGASANLLENYYCTAKVCSGLGRCFSDPILARCEKCGKIPNAEANCYTYNTEFECTNGEEVKSSGGKILKSKDTCDWGRCLWIGDKESNKGSCVKDGNADSKDDCVIFDNPAEKQKCQGDMNPPKTKLAQDKISTVSHGHPNLEFIGDDSYHAKWTENSPLRALGYCLSNTEADTSAVCENFTTINYKGAKQQENLMVNLINSSYLQGKVINGQTYRLQFYSEDKFFNREDVQEAFIFIDNVKPEFEIREEVNTVKDATALKVYLEGTSEPMSCEFKLKSLIPLGSEQNKMLKREEAKGATFEGLKGIKYNLTVTCRDDYDNVEIKNVIEIFNLDQNIQLVYPVFKEVIAATEIKFQVNTEVGASCGLYDGLTNEKIIYFNIMDEEGKVHETPLLDGFIEGVYAGEHKVRCTEILDTNKVHEVLFYFIVDFTSPETQIELKEGKRVEKPSIYGWEEYFINSVMVNFECKAEGFACDKTYYCLGGGCESIGNPDYKEFTREFSLNGSSQICYYSTDSGNNKVFQPVCGMAIIDGYGITLEKPPLNYYNGEVWGVSNKKGFDWQFYTRVPTSLCKYDFSEDFVYEEVAGFKILQPNIEKRYLVENFPNGTGASVYGEGGRVKSVFVKCENLEGEIGPEKKINLEYDPTAPNILTANAEPDLLIEGTKVKLNVITDDKTLCKFSDLESADYNTMKFVFPGAEAENSLGSKQARILTENHSAVYAVNNFLGLVKEFNLTVQCRNGAGDRSEKKNIMFKVDYTQLGGISSIWPKGDYLADASVLAKVETTKSGTCSYNINGTYIKMNSFGGKTHNVQFSNLKEGSYNYQIRCKMGEHVVEGEISFTIDLTTPIISKVDDGSYSCGSPEVNLLVYTNKQNVSQYYYEVYDLGAKQTAGKKISIDSLNSEEEYYNYYTGYVQNSLSNNSNVNINDDVLKGNLVYNATVGNNLPINISTINFNESHSYATRVKVKSLTGKWGLFKGSDGIMIVSSNYSECLKDKTVPGIDFNEKGTCTNKEIELNCNDNIVGCKTFLFGVSDSVDNCVPKEFYSGEKIVFTEKKWLCYKVSDYSGNNYANSIMVSLEDSDGDGLLDSCDTCLKTKAGSKVDELGCASDDLKSEDKKEDSDGDGLPDMFEKMYDEEGCELNYRGVDSNNNGVLDRDEDYDKDTYSNYEEYTNNQDPCTADTPLEKKEEKEKEVIKAVPPVEEKGATVLVGVLLILGVLFILGGSSYLIYYYNYSSAGKGRQVRDGGVISRGKEEEREVPGGMLGNLKNKVLELEKSREQKLKERSREQVFGTFGDQKEIPHIGGMLETKNASLPKLQQIAEKYVEHKEDIKPVLKKEEKGVFAKLESIATQTKEKKINEVVSGEEAKELFAKLKSISQKRKGK
ncbi:carboxypeptidase regulatory-like domain-containing protein [Candidatus Woesearchaeota archaeon]|nr:carboxypeptidase regulatory-like domain-containing protein [Candidatus Woesearchaeota archaeon]